MWCSALYPFIPHGALNVILDRHVKQSSFIYLPLYNGFYKTSEILLFRSRHGPVLLKTIHCLGAEGQRLFYTMIVEDKYGFSRCWKILHAKSECGSGALWFLSSTSTLTFWGSLQKRASSGLWRKRWFGTKWLRKLTRSASGSGYYWKFHWPEPWRSAGRLKRRWLRKTACPGNQQSTVRVIMPTRPRQSTHGKTCYRCGSPQHTALFKGCPARYESCNNCKKKGHFEKKVCMAVSEITVPEVTVLNVTVLNSYCDKGRCYTWC